MSEAEISLYLDRYNFLLNQTVQNMRKIINEYLEKVPQVPIPNKKKTRRVGLYKIGPDKWYLIRRQIDNYKDGERKLYKRIPETEFIKRWENVPATMDIGNVLQQQYRVKWDGRCSIITRSLHSPIEYNLTDELLTVHIDTIVKSS